ncbi:MAG: lipid A export permease/ATP-binding protein MsbA [Pseudomonadota bacterium]
MNNSEPTEYSGVVVYRRLLRYVRPYSAAFFVAIIGMGFVAATETGFAALMQPLLDGTFVAKDPLQIQIVPFLIVAIFLVRGAATFASSYMMSWIGRRVIKDLRTQMFSRLLALPARFYDRIGSGQIISKLVYDVEQVSDAASQAITVLVQDSLTLAGLLAWMFYLNWQLTLLFIVLGPVTAILARYVNARLRTISRRLQGSVSDVTQIAQEAIDAHRVVKIFGGQTHEAAQFEIVNNNNRLQNMKIVATAAASVPVIQLIAACILALVIFIITRPEMIEKTSVGQFMSFISAMLLLLAPLKRLTNINGALQRGIAAAQSVFQFLDTDIEYNHGTLTLTRAQGHIEFRNLTFAYDERHGPVIRDINLDIKPGTTVAFVGRSGSGKSTLVSLLPRFYLAPRGTITLDGVDINDIQLSDLRRQIALVSQEVILFNDTIAHNIGYGLFENADMDAIKAAAQAAHAWEFIEQLPLGLQTVVGERGVMLSGGQRQRLAIARAILKNAPILILDEATSALDTESERHIQAALTELIKNRTTLVIAHRLSTIEKADQIVVMYEGRIVETGNHRQLLAHKGHYTSLHRMQFSEIAHAH